MRIITVYGSDSSSRFKLIVGCGSTSSETTAEGQRDYFVEPQSNLPVITNFFFFFFFSSSISHYAFEPIPTL